MSRSHAMTFRVDGDSNDVRDLGNDLVTAIDRAQRDGRHADVVVSGPTIRPICPGCVEPCGQCAGVDEGIDPIPSE